MACPDEDLIANFVERRLPETSKAAVTAHADVCTTCRRVIAAAADGLYPRSLGTSTLPMQRRSPPAAMLAAGELVGRYRILHVLGCGGMGVVYAAFDPELQRQVALKLVRNEDAGVDDELRTRLTREAQAMARVRHPNVITVFDVGTWRGQLFVAMEAIDGSTLSTWLEAQPRSVADILQVLHAAGRGLAAAHAAGLVHRDFKPDNVLIGADGRVCVTDFGLARPVTMREPSSPSPDGDSDQWTLTLTRAGVAVGTPAYMAPEQMRGDTADERADQFSFCVALFEALYGVRPFAGGSMGEIELNILTAPPRRRQRRGVSRAVRRVLARGLAPSPVSRFASMDELLAMLPPSRRRRRVIVSGTAFALAAIALAAVGWRVQSSAQRAAMCRGAAARLAGVWDGPRRAAVVAALGPETGARVAAALDGYAAAWVAAHVDACEATHVRGEQSEMLLDLRMQCLEQRRVELDELGGLLARDPSVADHAAQAARQLPSVAMCADPRALERQRAAPSVAQWRLQAPRRLWARARAEELAGDCGRALADAQTATKQAKHADSDALAAETLLETALAQRCLGDETAAKATLVEAAVAAARAHDERLVTRVACQGVQLSGHAGEFADADRWSRMATEAADRSDDDAGAQAERLYSLALLAWWRDYLADAEALHLKAQVYYDRLGDGGALDRLRNLEQLAVVVSSRGHFAEAAELQRHVYDRFAALLGPDHHKTLGAMENLALDAWEQGDDAAGLAGERRFIERIGSRYPSHATTALANYGWMLVQTGRPAEALAPLHRALETAATIKGAHDAQEAYAESGLGAAWVALGAPARARPSLEHALGLQKVEDEPFDRSQTAFALAQALWPLPSQRARALTLATESRRFLASHPLGARQAQRLAAVDAWLRGHVLP